MNEHNWEYGSRPKKYAWLCRIWIFHSRCTQNLKEPQSVKTTSNLQFALRYPKIIQTSTNQEYQTTDQQTQIPNHSTTTPKKWLSCCFCKRMHSCIRSRDSQRRNLSRLSGLQPVETMVRPAYKPRTRRKTLQPYGSPFKTSSWQWPQVTLKSKYLQMPCRQQIQKQCYKHHNKQERKKERNKQNFQTHFRRNHLNPTLQVTLESRPSLQSQTKPGLRPGFFCNQQAETVWRLVHAGD